MPDAPRNSRTFVRLLGFLGSYRLSLVVSIALAVGYQAAGLIATYLTGSVAAAIEAGERHRLSFLVGAILVLGVVRALLMAGRRLISGYQALGVEMDMRNRVYA
jgi:hypothetical protein